MQFSAALLNTQAGDLEGLLGPAAWIQFFTGVGPPDPTDPDDGTMLAEVQVPPDWLTTPVQGMVEKPFDVRWAATVVVPGDLGHFRIKDAAKVTCHVQGSVGVTGADCLVNSLVVRIGMVVDVLSFRYIRGPM